MASIPNLLTGRRGPRSRGSRGGRAISGNNGDDQTTEAIESGRDKIIQQTDGDATNSRLSAVTLGYLEDPFARELIAQGERVPRRYPIINRGTYVRTTAIDVLVKQFLHHEPEQRKQIVSLGAGSDTRFWRLWTTSLSERFAPVTYHELDFETNVQQKRTFTRQSQPITSTTLQAQRAGWNYHLHALDLRNLTSKSPPQIPELDLELPTLILSECCLCYLPPDTAASVLQYFTMNLKASLGIILYEPIRPFDAFGKTMVTNLASRGIHLQTLKRYGSLEMQRQRLRLAGFSDGQGARDISQLYQGDPWISQAERDRVEKLEWLDEVEEWKLLASHYCVAWGWRGADFGEAWARLEGARTNSEEQDDGMG